MQCAWCGKEIKDKDESMEYTHDDKSKEYTHTGSCEGEFDNSRGLVTMAEKNPPPKVTVEEVKVTEKPVVMINDAVNTANDVRGSE